MPVEQASSTLAQLTSLSRIARHRFGAAAIALLCAGCTVSVDSQAEGKYSCESNADCIDGFECRGGLCFKEGSASGGDTVVGDADSGDSLAGDSSDGDSGSANLCAEAGCATLDDCFVRDGTPYCDTGCTSDADCTGNIAWPGIEGTISFDCGSSSCRCVEPVLYDEGEERGVCRPLCHATGCTYTGHWCVNIFEHGSESIANVCSRSPCSVHCQVSSDIGCSYDTTTRCCVRDGFDQRLEDAAGRAHCFEPCQQDEECDIGTALLPDGERDFVEHDCTGGSCSCVRDGLLANFFGGDGICALDCDHTDPDCPSGSMCRDEPRYGFDDESAPVCAYDPCVSNPCPGTSLCRPMGSEYFCVAQCSATEPSCAGVGYHVESFNEWEPPLWVDCSQGCECVEDVVFHDPVGGLCRKGCTAQDDCMGLGEMCMPVDDMNMSSTMACLNPCLGAPCPQQYCIPILDQYVPEYPSVCEDECSSALDCDGKSYYVPSPSGTPVHYTCGVDACICVAQGGGMDASTQRHVCRPSCTATELQSGIGCDAVQELECRQVARFESSGGPTVPEPFGAPGCGISKKDECMPGELFIPTPDGPFCAPPCNNLECMSLLILPDGSQIDCNIAGNCACVKPDGINEVCLPTCTDTTASPCQTQAGPTVEMQCQSMTDVQGTTVDVCAGGPADECSCGFDQYCVDGVCLWGCQHDVDCEGQSYWRSETELQCNGECVCVDNSHNNRGECALPTSSPQCISPPTTMVQSWFFGPTSPNVEVCLRN